MKPLLFTIAICIGVASNASAATRYPYVTTIGAGDFNAARIAYGEQAAAGEPGRDAIPAFTSVAAYHYYYRFAEDTSCDERCVQAAYFKLREERSIEFIPLGQRVTVMGEMRDATDRRYPICRIRLKPDTSSRVLLCLSLSDWPPSKR